ncbi:MAG: RES family NAD+ phosphorylase [Deltaproteobacteria bacterium]|nr:RES family NAD+ phosphorylase [Deltaproteobacteria bacterium]
MKPEKVPFKPTARNFSSFRNIATFSLPQNIYDDIAPPSAFETIYKHENSSSGIDHQKKKINRPFQYGDASLSLYVFQKLKWKRGRFSSGMKYGVWYGALEEETSRLEILYHLLKQSKELFQNPKISDPQIVHQRVMLKAQCRASRLVDLTKMPSIHAKLTDDNYVFCYSMGERAMRENMDAFFSPSARVSGGTCTPIFNPDTIQKDEIIYYFDFIVHRDMRVKYKKSQIEALTIPSQWNI